MMHTLMHFLISDNYTLAGQRHIYAICNVVGTNCTHVDGYGQRHCLYVHSNLLLVDSCM